MATLDQNNKNLDLTVTSGNSGLSSGAPFDPKVGVSSQMFDPIDGMSSTKKLRSHLEFNSNEDHVLLSCKGLAAKSKVKEFYRCEVVDGQKLFTCIWTNCSFTTKLSSKIATHINLSHIGVHLKCPKANCSKMFNNPNTYRDHLKNHICGFGIFGYGSKGVLDSCSNNNINQYRQKLSIKGQRFYRCVFDVDGSQCGSITKYHMAMKRHIHSHICPYRKNLRLLQNKRLIRQMKRQTWDLGQTDDLPDSCKITEGSSFNTSSDQNGILSKDVYQCRRENCTQVFSSSAELLKHEDFLCIFVKNHKLQSLINGTKKLGKHMPKISSQELAACVDTTPLKRKRGPRKKRIMTVSHQSNPPRTRRPRSKKLKEQNDQVFRSSSRILTRIIKNKQLEYADQSSSSDSGMSVDSHDWSKSWQSIEDEDDKPLSIVCDLNPSELIRYSTPESSNDSDSINDTNFLADLLKEKPILKQTIDTLIEYGVDAKEAFNALNLDQINNHNESNDLIIDFTDDELTDEKFPYFKELFEKEMSDKNKTEFGLKCEIKELEQSIGLIENLLKQTIDSDVNNIMQLKDTLISNLFESVQQK